MKTFIYLFGFFTLAISPVTCTLEQQQAIQQTNTTDPNATGSDNAAAQQATLDATVHATTEIDPPYTVPTKP